MSKTMSAKEIGEAWLAYVDETFLLQDGSLGPGVQEEYLRLAETDSIRQYRQLWRGYTDTMIEGILDCPAEERGQHLAGIDVRSLAYVQDRIQCGTELLAALAHQGMQLKVGEGAFSLPEFFRHILLQEGLAEPGAQAEPESESER